MNNLTEEEQKAIDIVDEIAFIRGIRQDADGKREDLKAIKDVFRLVDNKQKEIEESIKAHQGYNEEKEKNNTLLVELASNNYISKDKIINKIKELEQEIEEKQEHGLDLTLIHEHEIDTNAIIQVLNELLEE